jgi:hypothetical protein
MEKEVNKVYTEWMPTTNPNAWYNFQSYGQKLLQTQNCLELSLVNEKMDASENFLIETSYINNLKITNEDKNRIYTKYFIPRDKFLNEIDEIDANTIGICIRKGDFKICFPETQIDDEIIIKWLNNMNNMNNMNNKILFCSDDKEYEKEMRQKINNAIIPNFSGNDIDFLYFILLSKCGKIYGTQKSSFSEEAAYFGGVEYIPLTKDFFK